MILHGVTQGDKIMRIREFFAGKILAEKYGYCLERLFLLKFFSLYGRRFLWENVFLFALNDTLFYEHIVS